MPYQAEKDATVPRVIAQGTNDAGEVTATYESVTYAAGAVIYETDIAPHILRRLEEGDDHLSTLLRYIDDAEARELLGEQAAEAQPVVEEDEILHADERVGDAPTVEPDWDNESSATQEVSDAPPEEPATGEKTAEPPAPEAEETVSEEVVDPETEAVETEQAETTEPESSEEEPAAVEEPESTEETTDEQSADESPGDTTEETVEEGQEGEKSSTDETSVEDLDSMSKTQLNRKARGIGIEGRSKMNEEELRTAIKAAEAG